jgi:hypothetical protein
LRGSLAAFAWNRHSRLSVGSGKARPSGPRERRKEVVMQKQKTVLATIAMLAALLYPAYALAQMGGGSSGGAPGSVTGSRSTTGLASDQVHISPPGTNSLGTANSSGVTTGMAGAEPKDSQRIDAEIRAEDTRIDAKINNICKGC